MKTLPLSRRTFAVVSLYFLTACAPEPAAPELAAPRPPTAPQKARPVPVSIRLDGGYALVVDEQDYLTVVGVAGHPDHRDGPEMTLTVETGEVDSDWPRTSTVPAAITDQPRWALNGYSMSIDSVDALKTEGVSLPPEGTGPLAECSEGGVTGAAANDLRYLPGVNDYVKPSKAVSVNRKLVESELVLRNGTLSIDKVGNCWKMAPADAKVAAGATDGQPMVLGEDSLIYSVAVPDNLTLRFTSLTPDQQDRSMTVKPVDGKISLWIDRNVSPTDTYAKRPPRLKLLAQDPHFALFYQLVPTIGARRELAVPHKVAEFSTPVNPGDECVPWFLSYRKWSAK